MKERLMFEFCYEPGKVKIWWEDESGGILREADGRELMEIVQRGIASFEMKRESEEPGR